MKQSQTILDTPEALFAEAKAIKSKSVGDAIAKAQEALALAQQMEAYQLEFDILMFLGRTFRIQGEAFACMEQLNKAYRSINQRFSKDSIKLSVVFREYGSLYSDHFNDHVTALDYSRKSLSLNNPEIVGPLYNNIGCQYVMLKQYDKAKHYLTKGKQISIEQEAYSTLSFIYENFGQMYAQQGNQAEAIMAYESGIEAARQAEKDTEDLQFIDYIHSYNLIGLAKVYLAAGQYDQLPDLIQTVYDKAIHSSLQSCWSEAAIIEGSMLLANEDTEAFVELFERARQFCKEHALHNDKGIWLQRMIDLCEKQEKYKEALYYSKKMIANKEAQEMRTKEMNIAKVLENKEVEILALENRNRKMQLQKNQLEQFAYIVAHDLKTPLSNISNFIGLFAKNYADQVDEQNKHYLDFILTNSRQLNRMFDELLRYITIKERGDKVVDCDVSHSIHRVRQKCEQQIAEKQGSIEFGILPRVKMSPYHLEVLLRRMVENSIKFSKADSPLRILIKVEENPEEYRFWVSDNGIGIQEEYHHKIFDLFKRLDKVNYDGTGMGLAICKKIVNIYGGKIEVSTNTWGGTTFEFNIPKGKFLP